MTNPLDAAEMVLGLVAEYDPRFTNLSADEHEAKKQAWAAQIAATNLQVEHLLEGARRAYSTPDRPFNPVGQVIHEAKEARKAASQGTAVRELGPAPSFDDGVAGDTGYALEEAYTANGAITIDCPSCGARQNEWCERAGQTMKIPHMTRAGAAYRTNHPLGRRRHSAREKHLEEHRRTYKPPWKNNTRSR